MKKNFIVGGITLIVLVGILTALGAYLRSVTKSHSPVEEVVYSNDEAKIIVVYCRPSKNDREIFGELVPFNEVWRTGANEATTFENSTNITINGQMLPSGKYSLWTIPNEREWEIILNNEIPNWGVSMMSGKANRDPEQDQLSVKVPSWEGDKQIEQFTITLEKMDNQLEMILMWDKTTVVVPISL